MSGTTHGLYIREFEKEQMTKLTCSCGKKFERPKDYLSETWRTDPMYRWKSSLCDECVELKVNAAFKRMPQILKTLQGD